MKYIKISAIALLLGFAATACHQSAGEASAEQGSEENNENGTIYLSPEQMELSEIVLGQPTVRKIASYIECSGRIDVPPSNIRSVHSPVTGFIQQINHLPGEYVRRGELLASIAHPDLIRLQREFLESAGKIVFLKKDMERKKELADADAASRKAYEQALSDYSVEDAHLNGLKAELGLIGINTQALEETRQVQQSIRIFTPVAGYLVKVEANPGKLVEPNVLLFEIVDNSHVHLELEVFAKDLGKLKEGQQVLASIPGSEEELRGQVHLINKSIDLEKKTANVHVHLDKEPDNLAIGTFLYARISTESREAPTVPEGAIVRSGGRSFVFVKEGERFRKVEVETGETDKGFVEVKELNLQEGQQIALKGAYYINGTE
ncbi:MAG: efflux RND transporter periplasmic adaptor subunit [Phaeodactylibacter sp.]|nr:efflux RND transporter periplasmic adaptor subunit [Phaeodactylibacter sp.]MCB9048665.1 efflux RND transporter periplasmic adaptor subunit [Lewinellaceae bacterium]